jgi:hypothetical protein
MVCGGLLAARAPAQTPDSARLNAMLACNTIDKKSARLACYDAQAQGAPVAAAPPTSPQAAAPAPLPQAASAPAYSPAPAAAPAATFGMENKKRARERQSRPRETKAIEARAVSAVDDGIGHYTIALDDGARWKMTESAPGFAPPRAGDEVRIRKGALGSFLMDVNKQTSVRVERIQ